MVVGKSVEICAVLIVLVHRGSCFTNEGFEDKRHPTLRIARWSIDVDVDFRG
jgi:hypothetical protein